MLNGGSLMTQAGTDFWFAEASVVDDAGKMDTDAYKCHGQ